MSLVQPREKCRRAVDVQALTMGSFRQEQGSACGNVTAKGPRQCRDWERWSSAARIPPPAPCRHQKLPPPCLAAPPGLQGPLPCSGITGTCISSMHPWISYINKCSCGINKVCTRQSLEITVEPQERIISTFRALNLGLQSEFDGTEVL